jgi:carbon monoxide dehydrogenase subunit G
MKEEVVVEGTRDAIWAVLEDASALQRVLPGAESLEEIGQGRYRGLLATRLGFMTVRADVEASLEDRAPPDHLRLAMTGRPRGLAGTFNVSIPIDLTTAGDDAARTTVAYSVDLTVTGRLATFGRPLLRTAMAREVAELVANLDRELERATSAAR